MVEERKKEWTKAELLNIAEAARAEIDIQDRSYHLSTYKKCFIAQDFTTWLISKGYARDRPEAVALGKELVANLFIVHVCRDHDFKDQHLFFRFMDDMRDKGHVLKPENGDPPKSWKQLLEQHPEMANRDIKPAELKQMLQGVSTFAEQDGELPHVMLDPTSLEMYDNIRPLEWVDPEVPREMEGEKFYDMVAIGGGAAGMVTTGATEFLGGKALMIERAFMGGDCLVTGCVPSKAFLKSASMAQKLRKGAEQFGLELDEGQVKVNFPKVMERMRKIRAEIAVHDSAENFSKEHGMDIILGAAKFIDPNTIMVNGKKIKFFKACICTGGRPRVPQTPGLDSVPFYTSENVWNMAKQPEKLLIVGAGPIACELGQGFQRLGTDVTMLARGSQFLPREDQDAADILKNQLERDGCDLQFNSQAIQYELVQAETETENPQIKVTIQKNGESEETIYNAIILAVGRLPNVEGLGLEEAGVQFSKEDGVKVNNQLQTTNKNIYSAGDCCTKLQFTHHSDIMARTVVYNSLLMKKLDINKTALPWSTFTDPEIATVGKTEQQLNAENIAYTVYRREFSQMDRAICDGAEHGFVKILTKEGKADILGATFVGGPAGDMISQVTMCMVNGLKISATGAGVSPYPSYADGIKNLTDQFNRTKLTPFVSGLLNTIIKFRR